MTGFLKCACSVAAMAAVGCANVRQAYDAQKAYADKGRGSAAARTARLDLRGWSLERLVDFAITNRPSVVSARLAVRDARLALRTIAASAPLASRTPWTSPDLSVSGDYAEQSEGSTVQDLDLKTDGGPSAGLSLQLTLWDFGRNDAQLRAQAERVMAAEQNLADTGYAVFCDVATQYFTYLKQSALHEVSIKNRNEYADHLRRTEARLDAGEANRLDVLKARLDLAQASEAVVTASNLVTTTGAALMNALGVDASRGTCAEVIGPAPRDLSSVRRGFARSSYTLEEAFAFARTNAPSVQVVRAKLRAASADVDYAIRDLLPEATATVGLSWANPLWAWNWGVGFAQSIFQGFRKTTAVDRARVALESAAADVDQSEQTLSLDLETAIADRDDADKAIETSIASLDSARENLDVVREQLEVGAVSRIELSEAISSHATALGSCITAFYGGQIAEAKLFGIIGRYPIYREETVTRQP